MRGGEGGAGIGVTGRVRTATPNDGAGGLAGDRFARAAVPAGGAFIALGVVGANLGALIASLGLVGLTISLSLKDVLANYVSGVMLLMQGPFKVGDAIAVDGMEGTVEDITARTTTLRAADGRQIHIPTLTDLGGAAAELARINCSGSACAPIICSKASRTKK